MKSNKIITKKTKNLSLAPDRSHAITCRRIFTHSPLFAIDCNLICLLLFGGLEVVVLQRYADASHRSSNSGRDKWFGIS